MVRSSFSAEIKHMRALPLLQIHIDYTKLGSKIPKRSLKRTKIRKNSSLYCAIQKKLYLRTRLC